MNKEKKKYSKEWLSKKEMRNLFRSSQITSRDLLLIRVCYYGALRVSEALQSIREDYKKDDEYSYLLLRSQKTDKKDWEKQPLPEFIYGEIHRYCEDRKIRTQDHVFQSNRSPKLSYSMAYKSITHMAKKIGINKMITTHTFRRSRATHLLDGELPLYDVSKLLRHKSIETTMKYLKISKKLLYNKVKEIDEKSILDTIES